MDPRFTREYAAEVWKLRKAEIDFMVNLARVVSGMKVDYTAEEVRG